MAFTEEQARLTRRIRLALSALGYPVPEADGPGTLAELAAMAPAMQRFAHDAGGAFLAELKAAPDPVAKARLLAEKAERVAQALGPFAGVVRAAGAVQEGVGVYRRMKREIDLVSGFLGKLTAAARR